VHHPEIALTRSYYDSLEDLSAEDRRRCGRAIHDFVRDPSHPGLGFGKIQGITGGRLCKIRAALDVRIILAREGNIYFPVLAGARAQIYERARRGRFVIDRVGEVIRFVEPRRPAEEGVDDREDPWTGRSIADEIPAGLLTIWSDAELREAGLDGAEIDTIRSLVSAEDLLELLGESWDEESVQLVLDLMEVTPEEWRSPDLLGDAAEVRLRRALSEFGALHGISKLFTPEELERIAANPIEDWMIFLHPAQRSATTRRYEGPARIRGSAGTGKTVVGLHWAAERARRSRDEGEGLPVLFTTYVKTLPPVFENLYLRMPDAIPGAVEFINVDKLAYRICTEAGERPSMDPNAVREASKDAFRQVVVPGTPLGDDGTSRSYLEAEVRSVIKGRGLESIEEYLGIHRTGRGTRFDGSRRRQAWEYMEAWNARMAASRIGDFPDTISLAVELAKARTKPTYRSAVIDEAQDLSLMGLQLVRALVNAPDDVDRSDGLLIVGDGAQRIYPGAFTLRQAGVEVRGRTTVLRRNYRNTAEILNAAMAVAGRGSVVDMDDEADAEPHRRDEEVGDAGRFGPRPLLVDCGTDDRETEFLVERIRGIVASGMMGLGGIGIFVPINSMVRSTLKRLGEHDISATGLKDYHGVPTPEVKVGTYARAKGLEFKVVFLPRVKAGVVPRAQTARQSDDEYADQRELAINEFFVAMTRARDQLIVSFGDEPSEVLVGVMDDFDVVTPEDL
jgi:hypothetical protein